MLNLYKNHISFSSGHDIYQICLPILTACQFSHFTYCKKFHNGSRAILTTTPDSLYDLYVNKKYIFSNEYRLEKYYNFSDHLINKNFLHYFQSDVCSIVPSKFDHIKKLCFQQMQYEIQQQNIFDRFNLIVKHAEYEEIFIFFISRSDYPKSTIINNFDLFSYFRLYFLDKAHQLIQKAENNKIITPFREDSFIEVNQHPFNNISELNIKRYYISGTDTYLTSQQMICAAYLMHSYTAKQIAKIMNLSYRTVENYIEIIKQKFSSQDRADLMQQLFVEFPNLPKRIGPWRFP